MPLESAFFGGGVAINGVSIPISGTENIVKYAENCYSSKTGIQYKRFIDFVL